jgi:fructose-1,6-bisphosphatase/inositol monophosphatase family enzyme
VSRRRSGQRALQRFLEANARLVAESLDHRRLRQKLTVKDQERQSLLVAVDVPYGGDALARTVATELARCSRRVMSLWCPSFDYVALAASRLDAIVCLGAEIEDKVAGLCIAQEAGAQVVGLSPRFEPTQLALDAGADYAPWFVAALSARALELVMSSLSRVKP